MINATRFVEGFSEIFTARIVDEGKLGAFVVLLSFLITFVGVRVITHAVRRGHRLLRNVRIGGTTVHYLVPGMGLDFGEGFLRATVRLFQKV